MLTPVERLGDLLFKREDLFQPYFDTPLNGSKLRQMINLIEGNLIDIVHNHNRAVITYTSVVSPQSVIVARVAKEYGLKCVIVIGTTDLRKSIESNHFLKWSEELGANIVAGSKISYNNVLYAKMLELNKQINAFVIKFGIDSDKYENFVIDPIAKQVANIPDRLANLIIPVGSAICTKGIFKGILDYGKKVDNIYCVQISGYDRSDVINKYLDKKLHYGFRLIDEREIGNRYIFYRDFLPIPQGIVFEYTFVPDKTYPYSKKVVADHDGVIDFDTRYESKAYMFYKRNKDIMKGETLFWIVGNNTK